MLSEINWPESGCYWPLAFNNLRELQGSSVVERHAVSLAFLNRGVATAAKIQFEQRGLTSETSTTSAIFEGDRYRGALLLLPIVVAPVFYIVRSDTLSIVGIPQTFTHAAALIRSGSARTNARARDRAETCGKRTELTQPPKSLVRGRVLRHIELPRR